MQVEALIWAPKVLGEPYRVSSRDVFPVESDRVFDREKPECVGWTVALNGGLYKVIGVDRFMPLSPIKPGEPIGLMVEPIHSTRPQ